MTAIPPQKAISARTHFAFQRVLINAENQLGVIVCELVEKDQLLVDFPNLKLQAAKGKQSLPLRLGANCYLSEDETKIYAATAGYPKLGGTFPENGSLHPSMITDLAVEPLLIIYSDRLKASLAVHPPLPGRRCLHQLDIPAVLQQAGIVYGINQQKLAELQTYLSERLAEFATIPIAQGEKPAHGENARLTYHIEVGPRPGKIRDDGSIDFRERNILIPVAENEIIASKIPATDGIAGITIFGEKLDARPGRDITIRTEQDAGHNLQTGQIFAKKAGTLSLVGGTVIRVCAHQEINGNIDYHTGNIHSSNCVIIRGNVLPGFSVRTEGNLEITGSVSAAHVHCAANLAIKGGVTGEKANIVSEGDADIYFIEQANLSCGGLSVIRKQAYFATIVSSGAIRAKADSTIIAGRLISEGSITAGSVGTDDAAPCLLAAGVVEQRLQLFEQCQKELSRQQQAIIDWLEEFPGTNRSRKVRQMEQEAATTKQLLLRYNLIPGSGIYSRAGEEEGLTGPEYRQDDSIDISAIGIEIFGTIAAGTRLRIGNRMLLLDKAVTNRLFRLDDTGKRIIAVPLRRRRSSD